jgi:hypothetical protein
MRRLLFLALGLGAFVAGARAHLRILHPSTKAPLYWQDPSNVSVVIQADGSADVPDESDRVALELAIAAWNRAPGTIARLALDQESSFASGTQWSSSAVHLLWFDETNASGYFPSGTGTVAVTPLWFFSDGRISDADVLFNGSGFAFTTSGQSGRFDIQDVATHELGHLLGLDHSGVTGATLYPYVDSTVILHRSPALDDIGGLRAAYPQGTWARFSGRVERPDGSPVFGAQVVALDALGRVASAGLSAANGDFLVEGLAAGSYRLYVAPLELPVSGANLTGSPALDAAFAPTAPGASLGLAAGQTLAVGDLVVAPDVSLQLGRSSDRLPLRAIRGQTVSLSVRGTGLNSSCSLTSSAPDLTITPLAWLGSYVSLQLTTPPDAELGAVDLIVQNLAGERAVLVGGVELTPPDPIVQSITPSLGSAAGGTLLTISGQGFRPGASVVIGDRIYPEGQPGGATRLDANTLQLTSAQTLVGQHDVIVIDETGVEGRLIDGFQAGLVPAIQTVFPPAGSAQGGTEVALTGQDFAPGLSVRLDGQPQTVLSVTLGSVARFSTEPGLAPGLYQLELENPGGETATSAFVIAAPADPLVTALEPASGASSGGEPLTIRGQHLPEDAEVWFGVDPLTGLGGQAAPSVVRLDSETLEVITPAGSGLATVVVRSPGSGQAGLAPESYQYSSAQGGGGCTTAPVRGDGGAGGWPGLLLLALLGWLLVQRPAPRARAL